jgi:hypothetical protein
MPLLRFITFILDVCLTTTTSTSTKTISKFQTSSSRPSSIGSTLKTPVTIADQYLTHYWSFDNGQMLDQIGKAHMTQGNLTTFTFDRFCNESSALALNGGWTQVPSGVYFDSPEFTISVWVYPQQIGVWSRVIDFGNGSNKDNILISIDSGSSNGVPTIHISTPTGVYRTKSSKAFIQYKWQHLAATFDSKQMSLYIDGILSGNVSFNKFNMSAKYRTSNYIGKSNWIRDGFSMSYLDELRLYNICLTQEEISEFVINETSE